MAPPARSGDPPPGQLLRSGTPELHPLLAQTMTGLAAAMLETFPNATMTAPRLPSPGWVTPASVPRPAGGWLTGGWLTGPVTGLEAYLAGRAAR